MAGDVEVGCLIVIDGDVAPYGPVGESVQDVLQWTVMCGTFVDGYSHCRVIYKLSVSWCVCQGVVHEDSKASWSREEIHRSGVEGSISTPGSVKLGACW